MKNTSNNKQLAKQFMAAMTANDEAHYEAILAEDVVLRVWGQNGREAHRAKKYVIHRLITEYGAWPDPSMEIFNITESDKQVAVEFRIQATEGEIYVEHNRAVFLTIVDGQINTLNFYCPEATPSIRRKNWIAPVDIKEDALIKILTSGMYRFDSREMVLPNSMGEINQEIVFWATDDPHPQGNGVAQARWTEENANAKIKETLAFFEKRGAGLRWFVGPLDTPADLAQRLENQGAILVNTVRMMARVGLDDLDIPTNPDIEIEVLSASKPQAVEDAVDIIMLGFNLPESQRENRIKFLFERLENPSIMETEILYLARIGGKPAAYANALYGNGIIHLGGAATLPQYRRQKVYATLLKRRLMDAQARGYNIAAIDAAPTTAPIVTNYGFKDYAQLYFYAWMPVVDMAVIKSLMPSYGEE